MFSEPPPEEPDDVFEEMSQELTPLQRKLRALPPFVMGASTGSLTVLSALVAWFITPPLGRIASVGSMALGGYGGSRVSKTLKEARRGVVPAVIADMVRESGVKGLKPKEVAKLQERYGVDALEFEAQLSSVYARYLRQLLGEDEILPSQISELGALRRGIGLRWNATASVHVEEAAGFLDGEQLPPGADLPAELNALLWLTTGLFGTSKGQADTRELCEVLGLDTASAQLTINAVSAPLYRKAVTRAVGKYNRTETPEVLAVARSALSLSEQAARSVHSEIYDAQLSLLLPDSAEGDAAALTEESMELLGELEGMLQVRSAAGRLEARTLPLFRAAVSASLGSAYAEGDGVTPIGAWGKIAVRQQELRLPTAAVISIMTEESRRIATSGLISAAEAQKLGTSPPADNAQLLRVTRFGSFLGEMLDVAALFEGEQTGSELTRWLHENGCQPRIILSAENHKL